MVVAAEAAVAAGVVEAAVVVVAVAQTEAEAEMPPSRSAPKRQSSSHTSWLPSP